MVTDRITVSLDERASEALERLVDESGAGRSEVVRRALRFYADNLPAARDARDVPVDEYHRMLSKGEHVLLDVDLLHVMLGYIEEDGSLPEGFTRQVDAVAAYHAREYEERFDDLGDLLDWMSLCGFLTVRESSADTYHVVFPSRQTRRFMVPFIRKSAAHLPFDIDIEPGVSKVILTRV